MTKCMVTFSTIVAAVLAMSAGSASAATLFHDNFNRAGSNSVGNGWTELERNANDVGILSNKLRLRDYVPGNPDAAAASLVIDASGYENIEVAFRWKANSGNEASDDLYLSWASAPAPAIDDQGAWTQVFQGNSGGTSWFSETVALNGAENSMFNIMLWSDVNAHNEGFRIDYVKVTGDAIAAVPLPAGFPLLIGGLAALGIMRRKRRHG